MLGVETTFSVYLPACAVEQPRESEIGQHLQTGSGRILVMDDEESLRNLLAQILKRLGSEVECAKEGAEAIELSKGKRFWALLRCSTCRFDHSWRHGRQRSRGSPEGSGQDRRFFWDSP
jgi:hypothetical protein